MTEACVDNIRSVHISWLFSSFVDKDLLNFLFNRSLSVLSRIVIQILQPRPNNFSEQALATCGVHLVKTNSFQNLKRIILFVWVQTSSRHLFDFCSVLLFELFFFMISQPHVDRIDSLSAQHRRLGDVSALTGYYIFVDVRLSLIGRVISMFDGDLF